MVEDEVELEVDAECLEGGKIVLRGELPIQAVVDHREAAIEIGVIEAGQDVERLEHAREFRAAQERDDVAQMAPDAVGIGVENRTGAHFVRACSHCGVSRAVPRDVKFVSGSSAAKLAGHGLPCQAGGPASGPSRIG